MEHIEVGFELLQFARKHGYRPEELIGQPGDTLYASGESYAALGEIAGRRPVAGRRRVGIPSHGGLARRTGLVS